MKQIKSSTICNFFYVFYVIYLIFFILSLISLIGAVVYMKKLGGAGIGLVVQSVLLSGLSVTAMACYYMMCDRALLAGAVKEVEEKFMNPKKH